MEYDIQYLPKEKWKGTIIPISYVTDKYFDVEVVKTDKGFNINIEEKKFPIRLNTNLKIMTFRTDSIKISMKIPALGESLKRMN